MNQFDVAEFATRFDHHDPQFGPNINEVFRHMRATSPVAHTEAYGGFHVLTRYKDIEQVVQRLLNDFVDDPRIFSELLADFVAFTGNERRRSELLEQRMRDAEEGRAKSEQARLAVEQAMNQRWLGKTLPAAVVRFRAALTAVEPAAGPATGGWMVTALGRGFSAGSVLVS